MVIEIKKSTIVKSVIVLLSIVIVSALGFFAYSKWGAKSQKEELASNINKAGALSMLIITDYGTTWNASIEHKEVEDEYGNKTYSYDFSSAINARIKYYQNADVLSYLDSLKTVMQIAMRKIDSNSKEDVAFTSAFEKVSKLINMAKEPMGSLFTFNQNTNIMYSDFGSSMDQLAVFQKIAPKDSMERWAVQFCQEKREGLMGNLRKKSAINKTQMQKEGFKPINGGIYYKCISKGKTKEHCTISDDVTVRYTGKLMNGEVFDSSINQPNNEVRFPLSNVIKGWQLALPHMSVGETAELVIPYDLAYGEYGTGPIPPFSNLRFTITLVRINK